MRCNDPSLTYLKNKGYNVIRLPRADIEPLEMVVSTGRRFERIGSLTTAILSEWPPPQVNRNVDCATVSGQRTSTLRLGIGATILGDIIAAMGGSNIGLSAALVGTRTLAFEFTDVLEDSVEIAALDQYLALGDVNPASLHVGRLLNEDAICVITSVIKSNRVLVKWEGSSSLESSLGATAIGNGTLKVSSSSQDTILIEGPRPLAFGCKAIRLTFEDGRYRAFSVEPPDRPFSAKGAQPKPVEELVAGTFVELS